MKILIVKLSALGDVIQALPVLKALKGALPRAEIHWVVEPPADELLASHPLLDQLILFPRRQILRALKKRNLSGLLTFLRTLRTHSYDVVIDLQGLLKSGLVVALSRARAKLGFANHREGSPLFYSLKLPPYDPDLHAVDRYLKVTEIFGAKPEAPLFVLPPLPSVGSLRQRFSLPEKYAVFIARARWESKLWERSSWQALALKCREAGLLPVLVGAENDRPYLKDIVQRSAARLLAGRLTLLELASLLKGAQLIVSVDTGPMHLAAALGKPVVALFGPTAPWRTGPYGDGHIVLRRDLPCSPCFRKVCPENECLKGISPEEVWQACQVLL